MYYQKDKNKNLRDSGNKMFSNKLFQNPSSKRWTSIYKLLHLQWGKGKQKKPQCFLLWGSLYITQNHQIAHKKKKKKERERERERKRNKEEERETKKKRKKDKERERKRERKKERDRKKEGGMSGG